MFCSHRHAVCMYTYIRTPFISIIYVNSLIREFGGIMTLNKSISMIFVQKKHASLFTLFNMEEY